LGLSPSCWTWHHETTDLLFCAKRSQRRSIFWTNLQKVVKPETGRVISEVQFVRGIDQLEEVIGIYIKFTDFDTSGRTFAFITMDLERCRAPRSVTMPASTSSEEPGRWLRNIRIALQLSTRDVEHLSRSIADQKGSQDYYISHAWVTDLEKGEYTPTIYKMSSLSIIYKRDYSEILGRFGVHLSDIGREQTALGLPRTHVIDLSAEHNIVIPPEIKDKIPLKHTNLVSKMFELWGRIPATILHGMTKHAVYGYVGMEDYTLYPLIRPGSFVEIDAKQKKIDRRSWSSEFDRPIYFVELRDSYVCSWCEVREDRLLLVPHPQSRAEIREVRYPYDAEIIGRVTAVSMKFAT
jgi:transcriptional regulator with XRE-family HTH domain